MAIVLFRVDERLIHGQVVVGWGAALHPDLIVVVDDELARSEWEQELYTMGLPPELEARFTDVEAAAALLPPLREDRRRTLLLTRDVATMRRLAAGGRMRGDEVNIGGIHHAPGRRGVLPYVYLSDSERDQLRELAAEGADVSARDLPGSKRVPLQQLLQPS